MDLHKNFPVFFWIEPIDASRGKNTTLLLRPVDNQMILIMDLNESKTKKS